MYPCKVFLFAVVSWLGITNCTSVQAQVKVMDNGPVYSGESVPYLFGAEVQYFRARGGSGRNVPKATVDALWDKLLDRVVESGMNAITLYIPWDFHEPVEGVFDFDGTLDQDHDGLPDYPSRDIKGFLRKVKAHNIKYVMVRPGPYINAEWGPLGFGAVPIWFLNGHPEALAQTRHNHARVASFSHPTYQKYAARWINELQKQVLADEIGPGKLIKMLQIDNETNFFWDSVYERDVGVYGVARYHGYLRGYYNQDIGQLNTAYNTTFTDFDQVNQPTSANDHAIANGRWHYDYYQWHDREIYEYFQFLRRTWEATGISSKDVLYTSCDSFNPPDFGLLPRLDYRQQDQLTLSTMNIYPKIYGTADLSTLNNPMKAAHDANLFRSSHAQYYGSAGRWVMATETMGGWFPPTEVTNAARQHTYGSLIGNGVKAMIIYYFHEGWNWDATETNDSTLAFDAPLDRDMNPRSSFALLKDLGKTLKSGLGSELMAGDPITSGQVLLAQDSTVQYPIANGFDTQTAASHWTAGLFGLLRATGVVPQVKFLDVMPDATLAAYRLVVWRDRGYIPAATLGQLTRYVQQGGHLVVVADPNRHVAISDVGAGVVTYADIDPSLGWNYDDFRRLTTASASLDTARTWMTAAGIELVTTVKDTQGKLSPFIHAWLYAANTKDHKGTLLFVENFQTTATMATVKIDATRLPASANLALCPKWRGDNQKVCVVASRNDVSGPGVSLPVSADGVDIWDVSAAEGVGIQ